MTMSERSQPNGSTIKASGPSTSSREATPASPFPRQAGAPGRRTTGTSGPKCAGSFANCAPPGSWQRTCADTLASAWTTSSWTWSVLALSHGHSCFLLRRSGPPTAGNGSSSSPATETGNLRCVSPGKASKLWPTPRASDGAHGSPNQHGSKGDLPLPAAIHAWATPKARDWRSGAVNADAVQRRTEKRPIQGPWDLPDQVCAAESNRPSGCLNPPWVEALMGFPLGWTEADGQSLLDFPRLPGSHLASPRAA